MKNRKMVETEQALLDAEFMRRLEQLEILARRVYRGRMKGERKSTVKGVSIDFADYRQYVRGDDLRFIDWNIYGRLDRLFLKLFFEEQDLNFYVLLDTSRSMDFGEPAKILFAKRMAAAMAYIALARMDRVCVGSITDALVDVLPPTRGKFMVHRMLEFLNRLPADGKTGLAEGVRKFLIRYPNPGVAVLISDLFDPAGYEEAFRLFLQRQCELHVIHVLSPQDLEPEVAGNMKLVDSETGEYTEVTINQHLLGHYRKMVERFQGEIRRFCTGRGIPYYPVRSDADVPRIILDMFRRQGLVK